MGTLIHRRLISALAALAVVVLTTASTTAMACADGRPCGIRVFSAPMMADGGQPSEDHSCCPAGPDEGGLVLARHAGCIYNGGIYAAKMQAPHALLLPAAVLPSALSIAAPRVQSVTSGDNAVGKPLWLAESPPGIRGPPVRNV